MWSSSNCHRPAALPCSRTEVPWQERISPSPDQCRCTQRWSSWEKVVIIFKARQNTKASFTSIYPFLQLKGKTSEKEQNPGITSLWMFASLWSPASPEHFIFQNFNRVSPGAFQFFSLKKKTWIQSYLVALLTLTTASPPEGGVFVLKGWLKFSFCWRWSEYLWLSR